VTHIYGNLYNHMKTTVDLPDALLIAAKKKAAEERVTLKVLIERGLRRQLAGPRAEKPRTRAIGWVTVAGGLPPGLDVRDRAAMREWIERRS
jgi:hypothetical protein